MNRPALLSVCLLISTGGFLLENACGGASEAPSHARAKIKHVVIIFQENRTPDNLFQDPVLIQRGADIASSGINSLGQNVPLVATPLGTGYDLDHSNAAFRAMYDHGKMDGADKIKVYCYTATPCPPADAQFRYVQPSDVGPYFQLAEQYTFGDRMFQTNEGPSFPAHQFMISGTSAPTASSSSFVAENPGGGPDVRNGINTGCIAPPAQFVYLIDAAGREPTKIYPCTEHPTLTDELKSAGINWLYYTPTAGSIWTAPNAIQHMCGPNSPPPNATACVGSDWVNNVVLDETRILTDISTGQLAQVSWVIPRGYNSDHAGSVSNTGGPSWVASVVNAIGSSPYWANTAIVITWDDWGGWYDHVPPFKVVNDGMSWGSGYVYGFRVPLIVVSPYARTQYISHQTHDFGSILKFVETVFGLPSLGYADAYAPDDLSDCFNFAQAPLVFRTISAPMQAQDFLNDKRLKTDPDDD